MEYVRINTDDVLSVGRAAKVLNCSRMTLYRRIDAGKVHAIKLGGILFVPRSEVERIKNKKAAGDEKEPAA